MKSYLRHDGSTDVIAFDYAKIAGQAVQPVPKTAWTENGQAGSLSALHGEIFICVDEAVLQARKFHTSWQSEIVRYLVHGVLHLLGPRRFPPGERADKA